MMRTLFLYLGVICIFSLDALAGEPLKGYRGYVNIAVGDAYNLNTARTISTNNMQWYTMITSTHGYVIKNWFVGGGLGYYHSYRDKENMYPLYAAGRYTFECNKLKPYIDAQAGIMYDPFWIEKVQEFGALSVGITVYKSLQVGLRGSVFRRPSRYFTVNAALVLSYAFGR